MEKTQPPRDAEGWQPVFGIGVLVGGFLMCWLIAYIGLYPLKQTPSATPTTVIPQALEKAPGFKVEDSEYLKLYADVVEYHSFIESLKFWWPVLSIIGFTLAGALAVAFVKTSVADATQVIRREITDDFKDKLTELKQSYEASLILIRKQVEEESALSKKANEQREQAAKDSEIKLRQIVTRAIDLGRGETEQSLGLTCWIHTEGISPQSPPAEVLKGINLLDLAIQYSERALRNFERTAPVETDDIEHHRDRLIYVCANLCYYYTSRHLLQPTEERSHQKAIYYVSQIIDSIGSLPDTDMKWSYLDSCLYAVFSAKPDYCDKEILKKGVLLYGTYHRDIKAYLAKRDLDLLSCRRIEDFDVLYDSGKKRLMA